MSPSSSYRSLARRRPATHQLIVFSLRHERFALPIRYVYKVVPMGAIYGVCHSTGISLTRYQNSDILVIDIQRRIFPELAESSQPAQLSASTDSQNHLQRGSSIDSSTGLAPALANSGNTANLKNVWRQNQPHLLLMQTQQNELIGFSLDVPPSLRRVSESAFSAIPAVYLKQSNIRCISALVTLSEEEPPAFLLNPNQLLQNQSPLLPSLEN